MPGRQWKCPDLRKVFNAKSKIVRKRIGQKDLPFRASLFKHISDSDLENFHELLGINTNSPYQYWANIFAEINLHLIQSKKSTETQEFIDYIESKLSPELASRIFCYFRTFGWRRLKRLSL